jgi:hypothetical protein
MIDFLWGRKTIHFNGKTFSKRPEFIKYIESNPRLEKKLVRETERKWFEIEDAFEKEINGRKSRY